MTLRNPHEGPASLPPGDAPGREATAKSAETRARIFAAARQVFTGYPFRAAGIRLIADAAGVRHPLVLHYFGSKTALFEDVALALEADVLAPPVPFLKALRNLETEGDFDFFLEQVARHALTQVDAFRAVMLNIGDPETPDKSLPGLSRMTEVRKKALKLVGGHILGGAPTVETDMFLFVFILALSHFSGAADFHRMALGLPDAEAYREWVEEDLKFIFRPVLMALARGRAESVTASWEPSPPGRGLDGKRPLAAPEGADRNPREKRVRKGEEARLAIIAAARRVFSRYPYNAASIRMIGSAGNFDFTRIHHFYPTKEDLFEAVAKDVCEEFIGAAVGWRRGLSGLPVTEVLTLYLKRALDYCFESCEALGLLMHNIAQYERFKHLAGFGYISRFLAGLLDNVLPLMPPDAPQERVRMWLYTIITLVYTFAGSPDYPASLMNVRADSEFYRRRIYETLIFVFSPSLLSVAGAAR